MSQFTSSVSANVNTAASTGAAVNNNYNGPSILSTTDNAKIGPDLDFNGQIGGFLTGQEIAAHRAEALIILIIIIISLIAIYILVTEEIIDIIARDLRSPVFVLGILASAVFIGWVFLRPRGTTPAEIADSVKLESATRHAIVALIIAYLAHLDLYFLSFVAVFIFVYLFTDWV